MAPEDSAPAAIPASPTGASPGEANPSSGGRRRRRRRNDNGGSRTVLLWIAAVILGACLIGAPMACGAVHRPIIFVVTGLTVALALLTAALATRSQATLKPYIAMVLPLLFLQRNRRGTSVDPRP